MDNVSPNIVLWSTELYKDYIAQWFFMEYNYILLGLIFLLTLEIIFISYNQMDVVLTYGHRPTLPQCGKVGVVFYELHSRDVKR